MEKTRIPLTALALLLTLSPSWAPRKAWCALGNPPGSPPSSGLRFLVPRATFSNHAETEFQAVVLEYNRDHPTGRVELIRQGENHSSLKELLTLHIAGQAPELAVIEASEFPALEKLGLAVPLNAPGIPKAAPARGVALPFRRTVPVLVADQEALQRVGGPSAALPRSWPEIAVLARKLSDPARAPQAGTADLKDGASEQFALAIPLQGSQGLWIFEALTGLPLWKRDGVGVRANRDLEKPIRAILALMDGGAPGSPALVSGEDTWEKSIQSFLDRKTPLLITSLDSLPLLSRLAPFRWSAAPLPTLTGKAASELEGGSLLIATKDSAEIREFLKYLYSNPIAARWLTSGGYLPWTSASGEISSEWRKLADALPEYRTMAVRLKARTARTSDPDVVRLHSAWTQALRLLFGERAKRLPTEFVLNHLDSQMNTGN